MIKKQKVRLDEVYGKAKPLTASVEADGRGIEINFKDFSVASMTKEGGPVLIENRNGIPFVVIWSDINAQDPTHQISLEGAMEKFRIKEDCCAICNKPLKGEVVIGRIGKSCGQRCHQECDALEREADDEELNK